LISTATIHLTDHKFAVLFSSELGPASTLSPERRSTAHKVGRFILELFARGGSNDTLKRGAGTRK
jgi:hypothetical protein